MAGPVLIEGIGAHISMSDDVWTSLADQFADDTYASVKGQVRTYVLHHHLMAHLPQPPAVVWTWAEELATSLFRWLTLGTT